MSQSNPVSRLLVGPGGWAHENAMSPERYRATTATVIRPVVCLPGAGGVRQPEDFSIRRQLTTGWAEIFASPDDFEKPPDR
jgi:hypothetical protein